MNGGLKTSSNAPITPEFGYHHEYSNINSAEMQDHTSLFKKSLLHKWHYKHSILCIVASPKRKLLFCGTQNSSIIVLDLVTFELKFEIPTHVGSVLCLHLSECENTLFSGGSDSLVKVWKIKDSPQSSEFYGSNSIQLVPTHTIYSLVDVGDIFSITYIEDLKTVFFGAQNASMSYVQIDSKGDPLSNEHYQLLPSNRFDRFFDSRGSATPNYKSSRSSPNSEFADLGISSSNISVIQVPSENIISYAHNGYLYAIDYLTIDNPLTSTIGNNIAEQYRHILISAGGDGEIKLWGYESNSTALSLLYSLSDPRIDSIFSMTINLPSLTIYAGLSDGNVCTWDLATFQLLKIFKIASDNVYTLALTPSLYQYKVDSNNLDDPQWLLMGTESGITKKLLPNGSEFGPAANSACYVRVTKDDPRLTLRTFIIDNISYLVSSGSDKTISLWSLETMDNTCVNNNLNGLNTNRSSTPSRAASPIIEQELDKPLSFSNENFFKTLGELISYKSVSKQPDIFMSECRKCANYLTVLLKSFGAHKTQLLPVSNGNPIVYSVFKANKPKANGKRPSRLVWYGHYDVIPASNVDKWNTSPFVMTPQDGYLYARGVTDNKGPLLVSIFAVAELLKNGALENDVAFIVEGEEEAGSWGFQNVMESFKSEIEGDGHIDWIMLSNSYWLDDKIPVLNYGLRGKIEIQLEVWSDKPDRHSGVDGGVITEPSMELVKLLSNLSENNRILIPGFEEFYSSDNSENNLNILKDWEIPLYNEISERVPNLDINELIRKWRLPSLTLHKIEMSGPDNGTVISQTSKAKLSIRIIPGQDLDVVRESFINFINLKFSEMHSTNHLRIKIMHEAEPWLGDVENLGYKTLFDCINEEWKSKPLFVREGGSIPAIRFLEKLFDCPALHLPTGQSSDNAHLNNERVRILNLLKSREIIKKAANRLPSGRS